MKPPTYYSTAKQAVYAYTQDVPFDMNGVRFPEYPESGVCAKAARCIWSAMHGGDPFPFAQRDQNKDGVVDALDMEQLMYDAGYAVRRTASCNAFENVRAIQKTTGKRILTTGSQIFFGGGKYGHVVTVISIDGDGSHLNDYMVFENTTARRDRRNGPGSIISMLNIVCGFSAEERILSVGHYKL